MPLVRRRWKKGTGDGVANRLSNLSGRSASTFIERNNVLGEAADRRAEIKSSSRNLGLPGEQLFRGESIKQGWSDLPPSMSWLRLASAFPVL